PARHRARQAGAWLAAGRGGLRTLWLGGEWLGPATGRLVGAVVALSAFGLLRDAFNAARDAVPAALDQAGVRAWLQAQPGVSAVHHVHIWSLGAGEIAMTAQLVRTEIGRASCRGRVEYA